MLKPHLLSVGLLATALTFAMVSTGRAATINYTGADLYNDPAVSFPSVQPNVVGTSLEFPAGSGHSAIQLKLPLSSADSFIFIASVSRTADDRDFDPYFVLGDGSIILGAVSANANDGPGGDDGSGGFAFSCTAGSISACEDPVFSELFESASVLPLESLIVELAFTLGPSSTSIALSFSGASTGSGSYTFNTALNRNALFFAILDDNDANASYRLNSLSITTVPVPAALPLLASGLGGLGFVAHRRSRKATLAA